MANHGGSRMRSEAALAPGRSLVSEIARSRARGLLLAREWPGRLAHVRGADGPGERGGPASRHLMEIA